MHFSASAGSFEVYGSLDMGVERVLVRFVVFVAVVAAVAAAVDTSTEPRALVAHICLAFPDPEHEFVEIGFLELAAARVFVFEAVVSAVWAVG